METSVNRWLAVFLALVFTAACAGTKQYTARGSGPLQVDRHGNSPTAEETAPAHPIREISTVPEVKNSAGNPVAYDFRPRKFVRDSVADGLTILKSPLGWDATDWLKASLVVGSTAALFAVDDEVRDLFQRNRNAATDDLAEVTEKFGNAKVLLPALGGLYMLGNTTDNTKFKRVSWLSIESYAVTTVFTGVLKVAAGRARPNTGDSSTSWKGFTTDDLSFPSAHSSAAFGIATIFAQEYEDNVIVPPLAYSMAALTGYSRLNDNKHWLSDVVLGSFIGYFTAKALWKIHEQDAAPQVAILPMAGNGTTGLSLIYRY